MGRLPHQGARHSTVDHGDASDGVFLLLRGCLGRASTSSSTCGCFLQVERSFSRMISLLFSLLMASRANGSLSLCEWQCLHVFRVDSSSPQETGAEPPRGWAGPTGLGRPTQAHFGPVRSPLHARGHSCHFALYHLHLHHFDDVILTSKMEGLLA
jgi:hypothetical protein